VLSRRAIRRGNFTAQADLTQKFLDKFDYYSTAEGA
jgi:hypothetical protein